MIKFNSVTLDAEMVLGDTGTFSITPKLDGDTYLSDGDTVYFTVRERKTKPDGTEPAKKIYKVITSFTDGTATIPIEPSDTASLDAGTYIYDIVVNRSDGTVDTLTPNGQAYFALKKGVK